jgi:serine/threonine protein kinase
VLILVEKTIHLSNPKKIFKKAEFKGKGGFGRVYFAKTPTTGKVAIKKMPHKSPKEKRMNLDEISVLNFCHHPNIVQYMKTYIYEDEVSVRRL